MVDSFLVPLLKIVIVLNATLVGMSFMTKLGSYRVEGKTLHMTE